MMAKMKKVREVLRYEVFDLKTGKVLKRGRYELHSFTRNFYRFMYSRHLAQQTVSLVRTNGSSWSLSISSGYSPAIKAPAKDDTYGMVVGTGTTAESFDDYKLEAKIPHGEGDNQLYYDGQTASATEDETNNKHIITEERNFYNYGSVDITINEIGLILRFYYKFLLFRSVLSTPITVPAGTGVRIIMEITIPYS